MKPKAFICERTAEYFLVGRLLRMLSGVASKAVPFYFWASQGSPVSQDCECGDEIRLVAVFARRPKIRRASRDRIVMKVNSQLIEAASVAARSGIPMFAAVPIVPSIYSFILPGLHVAGLNSRTATTNVPTFNLSWGWTVHS